MADYEKLYHEVREDIIGYYRYSKGVSPRRCQDGGVGQVVNDQRQHELANGSGLSQIASITFDSIGCM